MAIDKGDRVERTARGIFVGALALACGACGSDQHTPHGGAGVGNANVSGAANHAGNSGSGGAAGDSGAANEGGAVSDGGAASDAGAAGEGGAVSNGGAVSDGGALSDGGRAGHGGAVAGTGGGTNSGGTNSGGTNSGGTNSGGTDATAGTNSGGSNTGGTSSGGTGGTDAGGSNSGGSNSGGGSATCGNTVLEGAEECDDGNLQNLDGCGASCRYEVVDRMTSISVQGTSAPAFCASTTNALGRAFSITALGQINGQVQQAINNGALNNLLQFSGLSDLTGSSDGSSLAVGFLPGVPDAAKGPWPAGNPIDFWFRVPATSVDAQGVALNSLSGSLTARSLSAGPGLLNLSLAIGGVPGTLSISNARLRATLNATPAPNVPSPPPTALAPGLTVFQSLTGSGTGQGICGDVTVESLAHIPVPASLASGGNFACLSCNGSRTYTACSGGSVEAGCNSILDLLIGGCKVLGCQGTLVTPTQPDVPAPGSASVHALSLGSGNAVPSDQSSGNKDAYSSYFKFDANRAHITGLR